MISIGSPLRGRRFPLSSPVLECRFLAPLPGWEGPEEGDKILNLNIGINLFRPLNTGWSLFSEDTANSIISYQ